MKRRTFIRNGFTMGLGAASFGTALAHNALADFSANNTPFLWLSGRFTTPFGKDN